MRRLYDLQREAVDLLKEHGLFAAGWRFQFDNAKNRGGCCKYGSQLITASKPIFSIERNQADFHNTILHEIAHALVGPGHHHDATWQRKAREIGCTGKRCHSMQTAEGRYAGTCGCGVDHHNKHRMQTRNGVLPTYRCNRCRQTVTWRLRW